MLKAVREENRERVEEVRSSEKRRRLAENGSYETSLLLTPVAFSVADSEGLGARN